MDEQQIRTVGIICPGEMGHAIGRELRADGVDVITCLKDRSERTKKLSKAAGMRDVQSLQEVVSQADIVLSILVPSNAETAANEIAVAIQQSGSVTHLVDCNAVSPDTVKRMDKAVRAAGGQFSDGSIIGLPPTSVQAPRLYVSGPNADAIQPLDSKGVLVKQIGSEIGQASGIKMCYAAMTKGTFALDFALAIVAERLNLLDELLQEFEYSQPESLRRMQTILPKLPAKAGRWVGEMEQIAATFAGLNVTPRFHEGAADIYTLIANSSLGKETPETIDHERTLQTTISELARPGGEGRTQ